MTKLPTNPERPTIGQSDALSDVLLKCMGCQPIQCVQDMSATLESLWVALVNMYKTDTNKTLQQASRYLRRLLSSSQRRAAAPILTRPRAHRRQAFARNGKVLPWMRHCGSKTGSHRLQTVMPSSRSYIAATYKTKLKLDKEVGGGGGSARQ